MKENNQKTLPLSVKAYTKLAFTSVTQIVRK